MTRKKTQNTATSQNKLSYQSYAVVSQGYVLAMPSRGKRYLFKKKNHRWNVVSYFNGSVGVSLTRGS